MHDLESGYATLFNGNHQRSGPLFQGRFHGVIVEDESHSSELTRYIHLNPVRAGLSPNPAQYRWSSHHWYLNPTGVPDWLDYRSVLAEFAVRESAARVAYKRFVDAGVHRPPENPLAAAVDGWILGGLDVRPALPRTGRGEYAAEPAGDDAGNDRQRRGIADGRQPRDDSGSVAGTGTAPARSRSIWRGNWSPNRWRCWRRISAGSRGAPSRKRCGACGSVWNTTPSSAGRRSGSPSAVIGAGLRRYSRMGSGLQNSILPESSVCHPRRSLTGKIEFCTGKIEFCKPDPSRSSVCHTRRSLAGKIEFCQAWPQCEGSSRYRARRTAVSFSM